jgi:hypothetical protein
MTPPPGGFDWLAPEEIEPSTASPSHQFGDSRLIAVHNKLQSL